MNWGYEEVVVDARETLDGFAVYSMGAQPRLVCVCIFEGDAMRITDALNQMDGNEVEE